MLITAGRSKDSIRRADYNFAVPLQPSLQSLPAGTTLITGTWAEQKPAARAVRHAVFVVEQNIPVALEWDEWDDLSLHAVVFDAARHPVGTGRLLPASFDRTFPHTGHIGRMAVLGHARRAGVGGALLRALMAAAPARGFRDIVLHAQSYVAPFYARRRPACRSRCAGHRDFTTGRLGRLREYSGL